MLYHIPKINFIELLGNIPVNILIVDDEIDQLESLRRGLKSKGYGVFEALNADDALQIMEQKISDIALLLTDYIMPGKDGIELLYEVRSKYGTFPVIMMSAYRTTDLLNSINKNVCDSFIQKPFTLSHLMVEIERLLPKRDDAKK
jgi:DNA-binding NtrC family response regulator